MGAVFLALALGILIGVSFGDSILVANQRDIIELMEERLESLGGLQRRQEEELRRWEAVAPLVFRSFEGALTGQWIVLIAPGEAEAEGMRALLQESGAQVTMALVGPSPGGGGQEGGEQARPDLEELAGLLASPGEGGLELPGLLLAGAPGAPPRPPDCCLLLAGREEFTPGAFFHELGRQLQERAIRGIVLLPRQEGGGAPAPSPQQPAPGPGTGLIENIDTFWGRVALLEMLAGEAVGP